MVPIERTRFFAPNVNADTAGSVFDEPPRQQVEKLRRDMCSTLLGDDIDPLELAVTAESPSEVPGHITDWRFTFRGHPQSSRRKCLLWMVFAGQVLKHPGISSGLAILRQSHQYRYVRQISFAVQDRGIEVPLRSHNRGEALV